MQGAGEVIVQFGRMVFEIQVLCTGFESGLEQRWAKDYLRKKLISNKRQQFYSRLIK